MIFFSLSDPNCGKRKILMSFYSYGTCEWFLKIVCKRIKVIRYGVIFMFICACCFFCNVFILIFIFIFFISSCCVRVMVWVSKCITVVCERYIVFSPLCTVPVFFQCYCSVIVAGVCNLCVCLLGENIWNTSRCASVV